MKKRPDLNLPSISTVELQGSSELKVFNNEEKLQAKSDTLSPNSDQKKVTQITDGAGATIMSLGNTSFSADHAQTKPAFLATCRSSEKVSIDSIQFGQPPPTNISGGSFSGSGNNIRSCNLLSNSLNFVSADDLGTIPGNARILTSPKRSRDSQCITDDGCNYSPVDTILSLSLSGYTDANQKTGKRSRVCESPLLADEKESGFLYYDTPQWNDSNVPISSGGRTRENINNLEQASHQIADSYLSNMLLSISSNADSPESILKSSAMSYRNTPSIIRNKAFRAATSGSHSSSFSIPRHILSCSSNSEYADCSSLMSERGFLHSRDSRFGQAVGRRLEYAFDSEWDSTSVSCYTPGSAAVSSELKVDKKMTLTP